MKKYLGPEMENAPLFTPVLFLIFNRPDTTQQVFNEIRKTRPNKLFIAADGPRKNNSNDVLLCQHTRDIVNLIDWDCEVHTLFREENLGCKFAVSSAIDWFFSHVDEGIILEDDCLPDQSFFRFCEELLEDYRDDNRIMVISGINLQKRNEYFHDSYYFSRFVHVWGWATWRRAWNLYDRNMKYWPEFREKKCLKMLFDNKKAIKFWTKVFDDTYQGNVDTWDFQWLFSCWTQGAYSILPNKNLVSNIGFGKNSTHTSNPSNLSNIPTKNISFPLQHPKFIIQDKYADDYTQDTYFSGPGIHEILKNKMSQIIHSFH